MKKKQYQEGTIKFSLNKISKAEKEIAKYLANNDIEFKAQFHIQGVSYWYDFYFPKLNLIIEYQGDYWHANPIKYKSGSYLNVINKGSILVDDIWKRDANKKKEAEAHGYKVVYVWESDYKISGIKLITDAINN